MNSIDNKGFKKWVNNISAKYKQSQIKAAIKVNSEMLSFYFELGMEISITSFKATYGSKFYDNLSKELIKNLPNVTGLSPVNIRYMERFYLLYKDKIQIFPQLVEELFSIPWGHHRYIIDKCKNVDEAFNQQVKNNINKFPERYRFQLSKEETILIQRSKNLTAEIWSKGKGERATFTICFYRTRNILMVLLKEEKTHI